MMFRKATIDDIDRIAEIYEEIHTEEEAGRVTIGWVRGVYPTRVTAEGSVTAGDMFVLTVPVDEFCDAKCACGSAHACGDTHANGIKIETLENGEVIVAAARINKEQVDVYANAAWNYDAPDDEVMVLHTLVVSPAVKGKGYGTEFVAFYEDFARQKGCRYLRMDTNARNTVARSLYSKLGYAEVGIVDSVFNGIPGVKLVCLEKTL